MKEDYIYTSIELSNLIIGFRKGILTEKQRRELEDWKNTNEDNRALFEQLIDSDGSQESYGDDFRQIDTDHALARFKKHLRTSPGVFRGGIPTVHRINRQQWLWVAATVVAIMSIGVMVYLSRSEQSPAVMGQVLVQSDIGPGGNRATLTLADGRIIDLNEDKAGIVVETGSLVYSDGTDLLSSGELELRAQQSEAGRNEPRILALTTPRGGNYHIVLSDGTKVWLNAASSLRYPESFDQRSREVELEGEAYFEVSQDPTRPFVVKSPTQKVEVLGTSFNLSAYQDDDFVSTTLLEGAVRVLGISGQQQAVHLMPGQQSIWQPQSGNVKVHEADTEEATAWKDGYLKFNDELLSSIMKKISRWYNVDIHYEGEVGPDQVFSGRISKFDNVSGVLELLELTGGVRFRIEERRIIIMV